MRSFEDFVNGVTVKKQRSDVARARNLGEEAEKRKKFIERLPPIKENANYIVENVYGVVRELIEARLSLDGYKSYSHEATVSYLQNLGFSSYEVNFIDDLRKIRNNIKYYGKDSNEEYMRDVVNFLNRIFNRLKELASL